MNKKLISLIKVFDKEEYADAFLQKGEMFCKTIGQFKKIEGDEARCDQYEAPSDWHQPDQISLTLTFKSPDGEEKSLELKDLAGPVIMQRTEQDRLNVFCMYAITIPDFEESYETEEERLIAVEKINSMLKVHSTLSDEMLSLGEYAVVIINVREFIEKVRKTAISEECSSWRGLVDYFNPNTFHGSFNEVESVFKKRDTYSYQKEYRFVFDSGKHDGEKTIHVGPLDEIAIKVKTKEINSKMELKLQE